VNIIFRSDLRFIICPIAIAYSMGQIIKLVCICQCKIRVEEHDGDIRVVFLSQFTKLIL